MLLNHNDFKKYLKRDSPPEFPTLPLTHEFIYFKFLSLAKPISSNRIEGLTLRRKIVINTTSSANRSTPPGSGGWPSGHGKGPSGGGRSNAPTKK